MARRHWPKSGPTGSTTPAPERSTGSSTPTITADATHHSAATHPCHASTTLRGITASQENAGGSRTNNEPGPLTVLVSHVFMGRKLILAISWILMRADECFDKSQQYLDNIK